MIKSLRTRFYSIGRIRDADPCTVVGVFILSLVVFLLLLAYPITMIVIGAQHKDQCPMQPLLGVWLIVAGAVTLFVIILLYLVYILTITTRLPYFAMGAFVLVGLISLFSFAWFITGNVWVYSNYATAEFVNTASALYCNKLLFLFAFWTVTTTYIIIGLILIAIFITSCCTFMISHEALGI